MVKYWLTFNEIDSVFRHPFTTLGMVPGTDSQKINLKKLYINLLHHQIVASALATKYLHEIIPEAEMGCMITKTLSYPENCHPQNVLLALKDNRKNNFYFRCSGKRCLPTAYKKRVGKTESYYPF